MKIAIPWMIYTELDSDEIDIKKLRDGENKYINFLPGEVVGVAEVIVVVNSAANEMEKMEK